MSEPMKKPNAVPESYGPRRPEILDMAQKTSDKLTDETTVTVINEFCSIVDRAEMKIVGVKVELKPTSDSNAIRVVQRYIKDGTCRLLETLVGNRNPGKYVAAVSRAKTGIDYTYVIGVEAESFDRMPRYLPPDTVTYTCPAARYGKVVRDIKNENDPHKNAKYAICYLTSKDFRKASGYCYNKDAASFRVFDADGELTDAYEPVKIPRDDEERFEQISCEVVMLPEIRAAGKIESDGMSAMFSLFDIENSIDWKAAGCLDEKQYYAFFCRDKDGNKATMFGRPVDGSGKIPDTLSTAGLPSGLYVKFSQMQINNDDTSIFHEGAKKVLFFGKHPEFAEDKERSFLYVAQFEQGACQYFPIKRREV